MRQTERIDWYQWVKDIQKGYTKNKEGMLQIIYNTKQCQNFINNNVVKFSDFFGMPEFDILNSDNNLKSEITSLAWEQLFRSIINLDIETCKRKSSSSSESAVFSYLQ